MKAEELSVGDWVLCDGKPYKITEVGGMVCLDYEYGLFASFKDIEPIPLTQEILQKNGFIGEEIYVAIFDKAHGNDFDYGVALDYVHELQHALRVCMADKEIVL